MGSINLSRRRSWVNLHRPCEVPSAYLRRITWISPFFLRLFKPNVPTDHRFLRRPQLLTRSVPLPMGRGIP